MSDAYRLVAASTVEVNVKRVINDGDEEPQRRFNIDAGYNRTDTGIEANFRLRLEAPAIHAETVTQARFIHPNGSTVDGNEIQRFLGEEGLDAVFPHLRDTIITITAKCGFPIRLPETLPQGDPESEEGHPVTQH